MTLTAFLAGWIALGHADALNEKLASVKPGATRAEVEALFKERDGGAQSPSSTRYYEPTNTVIEVSYDQTGGTWTPDNRVSAPPVLYHRTRSTL